MSRQFSKLLEPGRIGPVQTRNRIIKTANGTSYMDWDTQRPGDRMIAYYERLAKGGVGYLTVESCGVEYPAGIQHVHYDGDRLIGGVQLHLESDEYIPAFAKLAEAIHRHGCPCSVQLQHAGAWNPTGLLPRRDTKAPSTFRKEELPGPDFAECRAMTRDEIEEMIEIWVRAAVRVWKAGFDGVEINHGTAHQGASFLSRVWNRREDNFGSQNFENRTRFLRSIVQGVKQSTDSRFAVTVLMNIAEFRNPRATSIEEGAEMAKLVAGAGADGINCRAHSYGHRGGLLQPDRLLYPVVPEDLPAGLDWSRGGRGATVPLVIAVKQRVDQIPVWTASRIDPEMGEEYLRRGSLDFVGMTRRLLAEPDLPRKLAEGRPEDICWCHGCLHCFDVRNKNMRLECRVNATLGRELEPEYTFTPAARRKKILIVGGGPAGMEAARLAAQRGHHVALYEKSSYLGGSIPMAAVVKELETRDLMTYIRYLEAQLRKERVRVHLRTEADAELIRRECPDAVIVATGAAYGRLQVPGADSGKVIPAGKLHRRLKWLLTYFGPAQLQRLTRYYMPVGKKVVVVGGTLHGCELTEFLVKRGRSVAMVHDGPEQDLGKGMTVDDLKNLWPWLKKMNVTIYSEVKYERVTDEGFVVTTREGRSMMLQADSILTTQDLVPNTGLADRLRSLVPEVHNVGSSADPGLIVDAVRDGARIGYAI